MGYFGIPFRNGVPIGLGSVASFGAQQFDPSSLFIGGTAGTWYDPSDPTTLFTTSTGTTSCAVPGSGSQVLVGLMLDKSQGAPGALGAELVTNGDFPVSLSGWTTSDGTPTWVVPGAMQLNSTSARQSAYQDIATVAGKTYEIRVTLSNFTSGGFAPRMVVWSGAFVSSLGFLGASAGSFVGRFTATASIIRLQPYADLGGIANFDNISVREIPGNHAIAFNDTTARPELSARVNLLTYSEQFDNGVWVKFASSVSANTFVAPDGSTTADTFAADGTNNLHRLQQAASGGVARTFSIYVKSNTAAFVQLLFDADIAPWANFDLTSGVVGSVGTNQTASIQNAGNGWFRCIVYSASTTATNVNIAIVSSASAARGEVNTSSGTLFIWGADLRPANIGSAIPSYQRIADQYTYDSNGFPSYLRFDGVDDSMYTPASINFSGTDKMSVFAGVRKLSDAAQGIFCELSSSTTSNNGTFRMTFPGGAGASSYAWLSKGTLQASITANLLAAPITNVVTGIGDIANDDCTIRIDGPTQVNQSTADQGTGNYGTYPLYIGSRANTSLFFNGHLYSLITAGTQLQSGSITATEQYVAGKTGVQI